MGCEGEDSRFISSFDNPLMSCRGDGTARIGDEGKAAGFIMAGGFAV